MENIARKIVEPAKIGDTLEVDVLIDRETTFNTDVSEYPVEDGFPVSDHVTRKPLTLSMTCVFTPSPVTWAGRNPSEGRMAQVARMLQEIYKKGEPITVTVPDAIYPNMIMTHAPLPRTVTDGIAYRIQLDFVQVRIVKQKTAEVSEDSTDEAAGMAGESEKDAGAASQEEIGTGMIVRDNENVLTTNTTAADYANAGDISTKKEFTAHAAALALAYSFAAQTWRG